MSTNTAPTAEPDPLASLRSKNKRRTPPKKESDGAPLAPVTPIAVPDPVADEAEAATPHSATTAPHVSPAPARPAPSPIAPPARSATTTATTAAQEWRERIRALEINPDLARIDTTQSYRREIALRTQDIVQRLREETGDIVKRTELVELAVMMLPDDMDEVSDALRELRKRGMRPGPGPAPQHLE